MSSNQNQNLFNNGFQQEDHAGSSSFGQAVLPPTPTSPSPLSNAFVGFGTNSSVAESRSARVTSAIHSSPTEMNTIFNSQLQSQQHHHSQPQVPTPPQQYHQQQQLANNSNPPVMIQFPFHYYLDNNNNVNVTQFYQIYPRDPVLGKNDPTAVQRFEVSGKQDYNQKMFSEVNSTQSFGARGTVDIQQNALHNLNKSNMPTQPDQSEWQQQQLQAAKDCETILNRDAFTQYYGPLLQTSYPTPNIMTLDAVSYQSAPTQPIRFNDEMSVQYDYPFDQHAYSDAQYDHDYHQPPTPASNSSRSPSPSLINQKPPVYTKWTEEEDQLLRSAISIYGPHKWSLIAAHVPNRTPMQCSTRWLGALNPTIHKGRWTPEEDSALKGAVAEYVDLVDSDGNPQPIPWNKIAARIPHRTGIQCQARWSEALDPRVRKGKWSPEEDDILKEGVRRFGRCWIRIAEMIDGRTQRQCRTRWVQIKNKQAKLDRDAIASAATGVGSSNDNDNSAVLLSPPSTTPPTPTLSSTITHNILVANNAIVQPALRHPIPPPLDMSQVQLHYQSSQQRCQSTNDDCAFRDESNSPCPSLKYKINLNLSPTGSVFSSAMPSANSPTSTPVAIANPHPPNHINPENMIIYTPTNELQSNRYSYIM